MRFIPKNRDLVLLLVAAIVALIYVATATSPWPAAIIYAFGVMMYEGR